MLNEFQVCKDDLGKTRAVAMEFPSLGEQEVLLKIEMFGLSANNVSYGAFANRFGYWDFFPRAEGWGVIPVWGIGVVTDSRSPEINVGERLYGYFPMASHCRIVAGGVTKLRLVDAAVHRQHLAAAYNNYARLTNDENYDQALDCERVYLLPLYATSYCVWDYLRDHHWFGGRQLVVLSASSKTALGFGYALTSDHSAPINIGFTSSRQIEMVSRLAIYGQVKSYGEIEELDASQPTLIVDMSGDSLLVARLRQHLAGNVTHCCSVGLTHAQAVDPHSSDQRDAFFFAPGHINKRAQEWGFAEYERRSRAFWRDAAIKSRDWLTLERLQGIDALGDAFLQLREGRISPYRGLVVSL